jgi:hypothetical protein
MSAVRIVIILACLIAATLTSEVFCLGACAFYDGHSVLGDDAVIIRQRSTLSLTLCVVQCSQLEKHALHREIKTTKSGNAFIELYADAEPFSYICSYLIRPAMLLNIIPQHDPKMLQRVRYEASLFGVEPIVRTIDELKRRCIGKAMIGAFKTGVSESAVKPDVQYGDCRRATKASYRRFSVLAKKIRPNGINVIKIPHLHREQ